MSSATPVLEADSLSKTFKRRKWLNKGRHEVHAVQDVSFSVGRGDVFGFLGPNGAGKSTTIRMALGLIHPTSGRVLIGGCDLASDPRRALRKVGAFVEAPSFYGYLSGWENLRIFAGLSGGVPVAEMERVVELVGLRGREHDPVNVFSHGMRQRLGIAACLLPRPELIILDEPTDGLDPHGIKEVRDLIKLLAREQGLTVFLSSHLLGEVENLCNRIAILEKGVKILEGSLSELEAEHRHWNIVSPQRERVEAFMLDKFKLRPLGPGGQFRLQDLQPADVNAALVRAGIEVSSFSREEDWLDRLFLELTTSRESFFKQGGS